MVDKNNEVVPFTTKVKKFGRNDYFSLDIPPLLCRNDFIYKNKLCTVKTAENDDKFSIIYEFNKKEE